MSATCHQSVWEVKNTLIQPAGGRKSLCFQFLIATKMIVAVAPAISLMVDQVHHLQKDGLGGKDAHYNHGLEVTTPVTVLGTRLVPHRSKLSRTV